MTAANTKHRPFTILVFDPGLAYTGWSAMELRPGERKLTIIQSGNLQLTREIKRVTHRDEVDRFGVRVVTLGMLEEELRRLFEEIQPDYVVTEDVFYNPTRPAAYTALLQWVTILEMYAFRNRMRVYRVPTRSAKQSIFGSGSANKTNVQHAVLSNPDIKFKKKSLTEGLTEHEADAIAIGWHFAVNVFPEVVQEHLLDPNHNS